MSLHNHSYSTRAIHVGSEADPITGAIVPRMSTATTFKQDGINKLRGGYDYSRSVNPTRLALEDLLTSLETGTSSNQGDDHSSTIGGRGKTFVFASGSAGTNAICNWVTRSVGQNGAGGRDGNGGGGHVLAINDVYGGTATFLARDCQPSGMEVTFLDMDKAGEEGIRAAIRPDTRLVWLEAATNPLLIVPPFQLVSSIVNSLPAETRPLILIDTTFLSSFNFTPLVSRSGSRSPGPGELPMADIVYSSLTKYSGGHSDIVLGALTLGPHTVHLRPNLVKCLRYVQENFGASASPRDCDLMIRSLKTLSMRMIKHGLNALRLSAWLASHPGFERVRYPGLKSDQAFSRVQEMISHNAKKELEYLGWKFPYQPESQPESESKRVISTPGTLAHDRTLGVPFGGMVTFAVKGATVEQAEQFCTSLKVATLAESLGGVETLVEVPYGMTHQHLSEETRAELGITPNLLRLSVGLEDIEDLIADLETALKAVKG
ncbi:hypothetical protein IAT40_003616 [Kwoniella sp. CBS 6097]